MIDNTPCPPPDLLARLLRGELPDEQAAGLEAHLSGCPHCERSVERLADSGPLAELMRQGARAPVALGPRLRAVVERAKQVPLPPPPSGTEELADATRPTLHPAPGAADSLAPSAFEPSEDAATRGVYEFLAPPEATGELGRLGGYRVLRLLGQGGMGCVFEAEDPRLGRRVAFKVMRPALMTSTVARERFLREAKAAAAVEDDHIVPVFQVGEDRGALFIAMPFLKGESLEDRLKRERRLAVPDLLKVARETALGLAAAHEHGLIHRDIKPANLWLEQTRRDAAPRAGESGEQSGVRAGRPAFRVKILDFGLARAVSSDNPDQPHLTQSGAVVGTPTYMAPEQARGEPLDFRADLFSLGSLLYRAATGESPFKAADTLSTLMAVATETPRPLRELAPDVPAALAALVERLMAKAKADRPASAREVAEAAAAIEEELRAAGTPLTVAPPALPVAAPPARPRRRVGVALAVTAGLLAVAAAVAVFFLQTPRGTLRVEIDDPQIEVAVKGTEIVLKNADKERAIKLTPGGKTLVVTRGDFTFETDKLVVRRGETAVVKVEWLPDKVQVLRDGAVIDSRNVPGAAAVGPAKPPVERPAAGPLDRLDPAAIPAAERYDWQPKELVAVLGEHGLRAWGGMTTVAFRPDGTLGTIGPDLFARFWDLKTMRQQPLVLPTAGMRHALVFAKNGKLAATAGGALDIWDLSGPQPRAKEIPLSTNAVALSVDGRFLASGHPDNSVRLWELTGIEPGELAALADHTGAVWSIALSPDSRTLASTGTDKTVRVWDVRDGKVTARAVFQPQPKGEMGPVAISPDGKTLVAGEYSGLGVEAFVHFWDLTPTKPAPLGALPGQGRALAFSPDSKTLAASSSMRPSVILFDLSGPKPRQQREFTDTEGGAGYDMLAFSPDGKTLAGGGFPPRVGVELWDLSGPEPKRRTERAGHRRSVQALAFAGDGKTLVSCDERALVVWDLGQAAPRKVAQPFGLMPTNAGLAQMTLAPQGPTLATVEGLSRVCQLWDLSDPSRAQPITFKGHPACTGVALTPDGKTLATAGGAPAAEVRLWDLTGEDLALLDANEPKRRGTIKLEKGTAAYWPALRPDGGMLAVITGAGDKWRPRLWDLSGAEPRQFADLGTNTGRTRYTFTPDSKGLLVLEPGDGELKLWDLSAQKLKARGLLQWGAFVQAAAVSPDGKTIALADNDGQVRLWDGKTRRWDGKSKKDDLPGWQLPGTVHSLAFSPCGKYLATANGNGTVYILRLPAAAP